MTSTPTHMYLSAGAIQAERFLVDHDCRFQRRRIDVSVPGTILWTSRVKTSTKYCPAHGPLLSHLVSKLSIFLNMAVVISALVLAIAGQGVSQLTGRGFPDCSSGPLKNNTVCDLSAGESNQSNSIRSELTTTRPSDKSHRPHQCLHLGREAEQHWSC